MNRRDPLLALLAYCAAGRDYGAESNGTGRTMRVGATFFGTPESSTLVRETLIQTLRGRGWIEGTNVVFDWTYAQGKPEVLPALVSELLPRKVDVIFASSMQSLRAAKDATKTVPIVMVGIGDPVAAGLVQSLARPEANLTGTSLQSAEVTEKSMENLKQTLPGLGRITVIRNPSNPNSNLYSTMVETAARKLGMRTENVDIQTAEQIEPAFGRMTGGAAALVLDPLFFANRRRMAELAIKRQLPIFAGERSYAVDGFLMTFGPDFGAIVRSSAGYVDKLLRGAKPGDLPIEQPTKFDLVVNLKTAKAIGVTVPQIMLLRADEVIQ